MIESQSGAGCMDLDMDEPAGPYGNGRNVMVWPCEGTPEQTWHTLNDGFTLLYVRVLGEDGCLTVDFGEPAGQDGAGYNVIATLDCDSATVWAENDSFIYTVIDNTNYCLDINRNERAGPGGNGFNLIAWPDCHGGPNQLWSPL